MRPKIITAMILTVLFGSGFVMGVAWDGRLDASPASSEEANGRRDDGGRRGLIVEGVGLTVEQKVSVDAVVDDYRQEMKALQEEFRPRYRSIIEETRGAIRELLSGEQAEEYDALLVEHDAKRAERSSRKSNR